MFSVTHSPLSSAVWTGLEPATPCVTGRYSNQLNYHTRFFEVHSGYCRFASAKIIRLFILCKYFSKKNVIFFFFSSIFIEKGYFLSFLQGELMNLSI